MDLIPQDTKEPDVLVKYQGVDVLLSDVSRSTRQIARSLPPAPRKQKLLNAMDETFDLIGGVPRLAVWADENPDDFYKLYGKTLPQQIQASIDGKIQCIIRPALPPSPLDGEYHEIQSGADRDLRSGGSEGTLTGSSPSDGGARREEDGMGG